MSVARKNGPGAGRTVLQASRWSAGVLIGCALALGLVGTGNLAQPAAAAPGLLDCSGSTMYALQNPGDTGVAGRVFAMDPASVGGGALSSSLVTTLPVGTAAANGLGTTEGGTAMYAVANGSAEDDEATVYGYDALTGVWSAYPGSNRSGAGGFVAGAIDPANKVFYYGRLTTPNAIVYGFDTATNTAIPGIIATFPVPQGAGGVTGGNGDFAFDAEGNLFVVATDANGVGGISVLDEPLPTVGSATGKALAATQLTTLNTGSAFSGIAFDNQGELYLSSPTDVQTVDPANGQALRGPTGWQGDAASERMTDLGSCSTPPVLKAQKNVVSRYAPTDQFTLSLTGGSITDGGTITTQGSATGIQKDADGNILTAGPVPTKAGTIYTATETAASGSLAHYFSSYTCVDTSNDATPGFPLSGSGTTVSFPFPERSAGGQTPTIACTFTNQAIRPALELVTTAEPASVGAVGDVVTFSFTMTNTGDVPLTEAGIEVPEFSGTGTLAPISCPADAALLEPTTSVTCTGSYRITPADLNASRLTLSTVATAAGPVGLTIRSDRATAHSDIIPLVVPPPASPSLPQTPVQAPVSSPQPLASTGSSTNPLNAMAAGGFLLAGIALCMSRVRSARRQRRQRTGASGRRP